MANLISGNAGIAGARIELVGFGTAISATATADSSGNYTISGLAADTYYLQCGLQGYLFSPATSIQTIVSSDITGVNFTATVFNPNKPGIWAKQGQVIPALNSLGDQPGRVLYDTNPQIISANPDGNVFKAWFMDGVASGGGNTSIFYAESNDGITWTRHSGAVIANAAWNTVFKNGSTYYLYGIAESVTSAGVVNVWTSSDGITWTSQGTGFSGTTGFDSSGIYQFSVVDIVNGTWRAIYTGQKTLGSGGVFLSLGFATSSNGLTWTRGNSGNPVFVNGSAQNVLKVGGTYYCWFNYTQFLAANPTSGTNPDLPTDIWRIQSTDLINWTNLIPALPRSRSVDAALLGANGTSVIGQVGNPSVVEANGKTYMFHMATTNGSTGNNPNMQFSLAIAQGPLSSVVNTHEGVFELQVLTIAEGENGASSAASIATPGFACLSGNTLIVHVRPNTTSPGTLTVSDTAGNTFTQVSTFTPVSPNGGKGFWFIRNNCLGNPANVVTVSWTGSATSFNGILCWQIANAPSGLSFDVDASNSTAVSGTSLVSNSFNTNFTNDIVLCACYPNGSTTCKGGTGYITDNQAVYTSAVHTSFTSKQTGIAASATAAVSATWAFYVAAFGANFVVPSLLMPDTIGNGICRPAIIYGRAPNGVLSAVTTDGNGNIDLSGQSPSIVDTIGNGVPTAVMIYGRAPSGQLQAVQTDGDGNLT